MIRGLRGCGCINVVDLRRFSYAFRARNRTDRWDTHTASLASGTCSTLAAARCNVSCGACSWCTRPRFGMPPVSTSCVSFAEIAGVWQAYSPRELRVRPQSHGDTRPGWLSRARRNCIDMVVAVNTDPVSHPSPRGLMAVTGTPNRYRGA
jgi:hypothetical protein